MNTNHFAKTGVLGMWLALSLGLAGCGPEPTPRLFDRSVDQLKAGKLAEGMAGLEEVLAREPSGASAAEAWNWLGLARWQVEDPDGATEAFERAAELAPGDWRPLYNRATLLLERGQTDLAFPLLREADKLNSTGTEVPLLLGELLTRRGQWEHAKRAYYQVQKRVEDRKNNPQSNDSKPEILQAQSVAALDGLGRVFTLTGDYEQAETQFLAALELRRDDGPALYNLGVMHALQGHAEEAAEYFRRYLDAAPDGERAEAARQGLAGEIPRQGGFGATAAAPDGAPAKQRAPAPAAETAASIWKHAVEGKSAAEAARALEVALANHDALGGEIAKRASAGFSKSLEVQLAAGAYWESVGAHRDALDAFRRAQALDSENAEALSALARVAVAANEFDTAVMALKRLRALEPANADALWQLAGIYADDLGMTGRAVNAYSEFERLFPADSRADGVRARIAELEAAATAAPEEEAP